MRPRVSWLTYGHTPEGMTRRTFLTASVALAATALAGLQTVSPELYDAGYIDGATGWQKFWHITMPLIKPIAVVVIVFSFVVTFADFQEIGRAHV